MDCRADFPILSTRVGKRPLVYLDNAATTQKPTCVLDAARRYYEEQNSNIHRGAHYLSRLATEKHEEARETVATFLNAASSHEIIFTSGCTAGINLVAQTLALSGLIGAGDEIIVTTDSHHSNIVPWQMLCRRRMALPATPLCRRMCGAPLCRRGEIAPACSAGWGISRDCTTANAWFTGTRASRMRSSARCCSAIRPMQRSCGPSCSISPCG